MVDVEETLTNAYVAIPFSLKSYNDLKVTNTDVLCGSVQSF